MKKYYFKCPKCGQDEVFYKVDDASDEGLGYLVLLGIGGYLATHEAGTEKIQCGECRNIFYKPIMPSSDLARILVFLFFIFLLVALGLMIYSMAPSLEEPGYYPQWLQQVAGYIGSHSYFIAVIMLPAFVMIVGVIFISGLFSNFFYRRKLKKDFKYKVEAFSKSEVDGGKA